MTTLVRARTRAHYDEYPLIERGPNRVAWWRASRVGVEEGLYEAIQAA